MSEHWSNRRLVVVGRNSKVWSALSRTTLLDDIVICAIGHAQLEQFVFQPGDQAWVFAYSRVRDENRVLLKTLARNKFIDVVYISSASTNVTQITQCYKYPALKQQAREDAIRFCSARIVNIGWFYRDPQELPAGRTAATSVAELAELMRTSWPTDKSEVNLFRMVERPFSNVIERVLYRCYGMLMTASGHFPCLLRPLDLVLRGLNMRWYGYLYLSNRLWSTMI